MSAQPPEALPGVQVSASQFAALGDPTRLALVEILADGDARSITSLAVGSGLTRQAITLHLKVLAGAGFVRSERVGRETQYAFQPEAIRDLRSYLDHVSHQWDDALSRLKSFVET